MTTVFFLVITVGVVTAYPLNSHHIFVNCNSPICNLNDVYGFHCKNGICTYVCSEDGCRQDDAPDWPLIYDCKNSNCAMDGFYDGCSGGACHNICSSKGCIHKRRGKKAKKLTKGNKFDRLATETAVVPEAKTERSHNDTVVENSIVLETTFAPSKETIEVELETSASKIEQISPTEKPMKMEKAKNEELNSTTVEPRVPRMTDPTTDVSEMKEERNEEAVVNRKVSARKTESSRTYIGEEKSKLSKKTLSEKGKPRNGTKKS